MKTLLVTACLFLVGAPIVAASVSAEFNRPLSFKSADEVYMLAVKPPQTWHPGFGAAMTYLTLYAPSRDERLSDQQRDALLVRIADGRSPRQLMILGFTFRVEILKRAHEADVKAAADALLAEDERAFLKMRASRAATELDMSYRILKELLDEEPDLERSTQTSQPR